jgi:hypothetical protein
MWQLDGRLGDLAMLLSQSYLFIEILLREHVSQRTMFFVLEAKHQEPNFM